MQKIIISFGAVCVLPLALVACQEAGTEWHEDSTEAMTVKSAPPAPSSPDNPTSLEDIDFTAYSQDLAKFIQFERGESWISAVDKVRLYFAPEAGAHIVKTSSSRFDRPDGAVIIMSVDNLADDSVRAQEVFLILSGPKDKLKLAEYGMRIKCWRGENKGMWQTDLCP